jgi:hypothetical protein
MFSHILRCVCFEEFHIYDTLLFIHEILNRVQVSSMKGFPGFKSQHTGRWYFKIAAASQQTPSLCYTLCKIFFHSFSHLIFIADMWLELCPFLEEEADFYRDLAAMRGCWILAVVEVLWNFGHALITL